MADLIVIEASDLNPLPEVLPDLIMVVSDSTNTSRKATTQQIRQWILNSSVLVNPTATTPATGNNTTAVATTQYVQSALAGLNLGIASNQNFGTVRTNTTDPVPVVYLKSEIDALNNAVRSVATGGTGGNTDTSARTALSAAKSGSNSDITALTALTSIPEIVQTALNAIYKTGFVITTASNNVPTGWLACDGSAVSRITYAALFAEIGTTYGIGNGSTTFNTPPMNDRFAIGVSGSKPLGSIGGNSNTALSIANLPSHNHGGSTNNMDRSLDHFHSAYSLNAGSHSHANDASTVNNTTAQGVFNRLGSGGSNGLNISPAGEHTHLVVVQNADRGLDHLHGIPSEGSGSLLNVQNPYVALKYLIKT